MCSRALQRKPARSRACPQLISPNIYASKKHLRRLGLAADLPGIEDFTSSEVSPEFVRHVTLIRNDEEPVAYALGVNCWALLLFVSLADHPTLHPKIASKFSSAVLREVLKRSPPCATPGNLVMLRSYDMHTTEPEMIRVPDVPRPEHFLRPTNDLGFATGGVFTTSRAIDRVVPEEKHRFLPEDAMHCGGLFRLADTLRCCVLDVPGDRVYSSYEILAGRDYSVWSAALGLKGSLRADPATRTVSVELISTGAGAQAGDEGVTLAFDAWEPYLRSKGAILPPMIWRAGACVLLEKTDVGVLMP